MTVVTLEAVKLSGRLQTISLTLRDQGLTCILGANGAGKSSLLVVLAGLLEPDSGRVSWDERNIYQQSLALLSTQRCYVSQQQSMGFELTGRECLLYLQHAEQDELPETVIERLDIAHLLDKPVSRMSGGEQQRIMISRALLQIWPAIHAGQGIIVLDEPLQGLDIRHQTSLMRWLKTLAQTGCQVVMSCHDINMANQYADNVALMKAGKLQQFGLTSDVLTLENLKSTFDCHFQCLLNDQHRHFIPV